MYTKCARYFIIIGLSVCAFGYGQQYGQNPYGQNPQNTIRNIPALTPGESGLSETGADRQIAELDKQINQLQKRAAQLQQQGQQCEQQANQVFFYDSLRARTLIHEADSYEAQAYQIQQQISRLQSQKENLQRYAH